MNEAVPKTDIGGYENQVEATLADITDKVVVARLWQKDHTVWKPEPTEITNRLGWLDVAGDMTKEVPRLRSFADDVRKAGYRHVVLLGMGGSSLGAAVLGQTFGNGGSHPELIVLDSTLPETIQATVDAINPALTLFLVSSKSGTTTEPLILYAFFRDLIEKAAGKEKAGQHFAAITDAGTPLVALAQRDGFRHTFLNPADIGGRYSVLSCFGLVPAALTGVDIAALLDRAEVMGKTCGAGVPANRNAGAWLGTVTGTLALSGRDKLTLVTSPAINAFPLWAEQLIAESTGKEGKGIIPISSEPVMEPDVYGDDRVFVYLRVAGDENQTADTAVNRLIASGQPVVVLPLKDTLDIGAEFFRWEFATAIAGAILGIQPFDQPDVQSAKTATAHLLQDFGKNGRLPRTESTGSFADLLAHAGKESYLAIMAYLHQTPATDGALTGLRKKVTRRYKIATTIGYGPRYLHSTGQLYKGGKNTGLFLQLTADHEKDLPVPGQPYSFGNVADAQALGDFQALQAAGRRVVRLNLPDGEASEIEGLL
jgi:glucose-6-phosphate isomerase/transaldolase/glucose-6-phosphate isomerase